MNGSLQYRTADFVPIPAWRRWWPVAAQEFASLFRTKGGIAMFCACLLPGVYKLVMLLILFGVVNFAPRGLQARLQRAEVGLDPHRIEFYLEPVLSVRPGMIFALLLTSLVTSRAVARDRVTNALELYWTRSISPGAYLFAKWVGCGLLFAVFTVAVPTVLWITSALLADDAERVLATAPQLARAILGLAAVTGAWTALCILVSTMCSAPNTAMVSWSVLLVGSAAIAFVLSRALQQPSLMSCLSVWDAGAVVARGIAGVPQRGASVTGVVTTLLALLAAFWWIAQRRLRLAEAIR